MQPYLLPYIGYWQLLAAVDRFVVYDNIQYTKRGWINRNRFLRNGTDAMFTVPVKAGSDFLDIRERSIADDFDPGTILRSIGAAYRKAPFFSETLSVVDQALEAPSRNLFEYLLHGMRIVARHLGIETPIVVSSSVPIDHGLRAQQKVIAMCRALGADTYYNPTGGRDLYSKEDFARNGIALGFVQSRTTPYAQFGEAFVPALSIVDVMMFNEPAVVRSMLGHYEVD